MKKVSQIIVKILIILLLVQPIFTTTCQAAGFWGDVLQTGKDFITNAQQQESPIEQEKLKSTVEQIYNMLFILGVILSVLVGALLGIKFIIGSVEEQAKIKETIMPYIIGCIVIFGAFGIWKLMIIILNNVTK